MQSPALLRGTTSVRPSTVSIRSPHVVRPNSRARRVPPCKALEIDWSDPDTLIGAAGNGESSPRYRRAKTQYGATTPRKTFGTELLCARAGAVLGIAMGIGFPIFYLRCFTRPFFLSVHTWCVTSEPHLNLVWLVAAGMPRTGRSWSTCVS